MSETRIHKYTNTQIHKYTNTQIQNTNPLVGQGGANKKMVGDEECNKLAPGDSYVVAATLARVAKITLLRLAGGKKILNILTL